MIHEAHRIGQLLTSTQESLIQKDISPIGEALLVRLILNPDHNRMLRIHL
jgi:hypothetical protein